MSQLKIEFNIDNNTFKQNGLSTEIYQIFATIQTKIALGYEDSKIKDTNENIIGQWKILE